MDIISMWVYLNVIISNFLKKILWFFLSKDERKSYASMFEQSNGNTIKAEEKE